MTDKGETDMSYETKSITRNDGSTTVDGLVLRAVSTGITRAEYDAGVANPQGGWLFQTNAPQFDDVIEIRDGRGTHIASVAVLDGIVVDAWGHVFAANTEAELAEKRAAIEPILQAVVRNSIAA